MRTGRSWAWSFVAPALFFLGLYLVYPSVATIYSSLLDRSSTEWVGLENYVYAFTSPAMLTAFRNNLLWLMVFTVVTVGLGLALAILTDRVRYESVAKSIIFLPMAISFVGAGVIWKFIYAYNPPGADQIGLLNQIVVWLGGEPVGWLLERPWVNNLALIMVGIWIWTGFAMVILSAAYKGIPRELKEAGRVDGASEWQLFWRISLPYIQSTVAVVTTSMIINVLKVFDIVYVMTNGNFGTEVVANRMYKEMFQLRHFGRASAVAVVLFLAIVPLMLVNIRRFRRQEVER